MIFQVIWKASLHFRHYVIYEGKTGLCTNVTLGLYPVQHFPDEPDTKTSLWFYDNLFFSALLNKQSNCSLLRFVFSN